jgi:hypothetical protein
LYWVVSDAVIENKAIHLPTYEWPSLDAQGIHIAWIHYSPTGCVVLCWRHALLATMWCFFPPFCSRSSSWLYFLWAYFTHCLTCLSVSLYRALKHVHMLSHTDTPTDSDPHAHTHALTQTHTHTFVDKQLKLMHSSTNKCAHKHTRKRKTIQGQRVGENRSPNTTVTFDPSHEVGIAGQGWTVCAMEAHRWSEVETVFKQTVNEWNAKHVFYIAVTANMMRQPWLNDHDHTVHLLMITFFF